MIGMTGYSSKELTIDDASIFTEIKSVNSRYLDLNVNVPFYLNFMDIKVRDLLKNKMNRGKIDISINIKLKENSNSISVDLKTARQYFESLGKLVKEFKLKDDVRLYNLTKYDDIITVEKKRDYAKYWSIVSKNILENIGEVMLMKEKEGAAIKKDLETIIKKIDTNLKIIIKKLPKMEKDIFNSLKDKINELMDGKVDEKRILNEAAVLVGKSCINEEIKRLESYITQFSEIINEKSDIGKRIDFLCQEMHREINTIGSKITMADLTKNVIVVKNEIEKIREHIRNIE